MSFSSSGSAAAASGRRSRRPGRGTRAAGPESSARQRIRARSPERAWMSSGADVEVVRVLVVERGADVLPVVAQRRLDLLLARRSAPAHRPGPGRAARGNGRRGSSSAMSGRSSSSAAISASSRCSGASSAAGRDLDLVGLAERALGERREPAQRLDLDVEEVDADGALLGRRVEVERCRRAWRTGRGPRPGRRARSRRRRGRAASSSRSSRSPMRDAQRVRAQRRGRAPSRDSATADTTTTGASASAAVVDQRVERRDPQARSGAAAA